MLPFEPDASPQDVAAHVRAIADARRPASFVRLSDGEGNILAYPMAGTKGLFRKTCDLMFGRPLDIDELAVVQRDMGAAAAGADILGVRDGQEVSKQNWARAVLDRYVDPAHPPMLASAFLNIRLARMGFWSELLYGRARIGLISCNDLRQTLASRLAIGHVDFWEVPSEAVRPTGRTFAGQDQDNLAHMPHRYEELRRTLAIPQPGQIVLVGAGVLGKAYCGWVKERGGFALDLGSVLDGWAELPTRQYLIDANQGFTLKPPKRLRLAAA